MKNALKLNRKQLLELYEKSNERIKESLCAEFREELFVIESKIVEMRIPKASKRKNRQSINWEAIFDFTPALRIAIYALFLGLIFLH